MTKALTHLKENHNVQLKWLSNQFTKTDPITNKNDAFLNSDSASRAFLKLNENLIVSDSDVEHFVSVYLSKSGLTKLKTTLRIYKKRQLDKATSRPKRKLDVTLYAHTMDRLDHLANISGKTKIDVITQLIEQSADSDFKIDVSVSEEEQLDLILRS
jgi:macrodomain Ter protein organizer (MatP/YcbG family)